MKKIPGFLLCLFLITFAGCNPGDPQAIIAKMVPDETEKLGETYISLVKEGKPEERRLYEAPELSNVPEENWQQVRKYLDLGALRSKKIIGYNHIRDSKVGVKEDIVYELEYERGWILADVVILEKNNLKQVAGFHANQIPDSLERLNAFTFKGKPVTHYLALVWAAVVPFFVIYTLILCIRTKMDKKWLWMLIILFANIFMKFNWATGNWFEGNRLSFGFNIGAGRAGFYGPWIFTLMIPFGSILFLFNRDKLKKIDA